MEGSCNRALFRNGRLHPCCGQGRQIPHCCRFRQPEVQQFCTAGGQHNVPRLQVPVHNPCAMRLIQRIRDLCSVLQHLLQRQRPLLQPLRQRLSFHTLHHQVIHAILTTHIMQRANVRMIQSRNRLGFSLESLLSRGIRRHFLRQNLDRHIPTESRILRSIHLSHSTCTER